MSKRELSFNSFFFMLKYKWRVDSMKKNGFTLIEIIGVIAILAFISVFAVPKIVNSIANKQQEIDLATQKIIYEGAREYFSTFDKFGSYKKSYCTTVKDLVAQNYLDSSITSKVDEEKGIIVTYNGTSFTYGYSDSCEKVSLMATDSKYAFWQTKFRESITSIEFNNDLSSVPDTCEYNDTTKCWDVSEKGNKSVIAYINNIKLYIAGYNTIYLNKDSSNLYDGFTKVESINMSLTDSSNIEKVDNYFNKNTLLKSIKSSVNIKTDLLL